MPNQINAAVLTNDFIKWGGGIDFLHAWLIAFNKIKSEKKEINIFILIPLPTQKQKIRKKLSLFKQFILKGNIKRKDERNIFDLDFLKNEFDKYGTIILFSDSKMGLIKKLRQIKASIILPTLKPIKNLYYPQVGYIPDLQHKYLKHFFSKKEINSRDEHYSSILKICNVTIVNSCNVKEDIGKYYPFVPGDKIITMPYCPAFKEEYYSAIGETLVKYNLPKRYFIISNQFWVHKDHNTAFKALAEFHKLTGQSDVAIVCTGDVHDYRMPDYINGLKESIHKLNIEKQILFLGFIPKKDQINIMRGSIAVIQPTLFEGGPGGGSVYDAVAYRVPAIVSDIKVNTEIREDDIYFFKTGSEKDLALKMHEVFNIDRKIYSTGELKNIYEKRVSEYSKVLLSIIKHTV